MQWLTLLKTFKHNRIQSWIIHRDLSINGDSRYSCLVHSVSLEFFLTYTKIYQEFQILHHPKAQLCLSFIIPSKCSDFCVDFDLV